MPDPTTPAKNLTQPLVGGDNNEWGYLLNTDLALIDTALGGTLAIAISANTTLNSTQAGNTGYKFTGTLSGTATITWPAFYGLAAIQNGTTGGHSIICGISAGTVTILNGETVAVWSDGTNFARLAATGGGATVPNAGLTNSSITIAGHAVALGGTQALAASDLTNGTTGSGAVVLATSPTVSELNVTGKVGIALGAAPTYNLQVSTSTDALAAYVLNTANSGAAIEGQATGTDATGVIGLGTNAGVLGESGAGGIGVEGFNTAGGVGGYFSSVSGYALVTATGNVGIGTTTPTALLEVGGAAKIDGALTVIGTPVGPTAAVGTNTTQFATTAFVQGNQLGVNVKAYGATGNGSTDDASAINSAISSLGSTGGIVFFPPGVYIVGSSITLPSKVILVGAGRGATILRAKPSTSVAVVETTNFSSLTGTNSTSGSYKFGLRSLSIDGNKANSATGNGLTVYGFDFNLDDLEIYNCSNICLYSEWGTSGTVPTSDGDSMEAHVHGLKTYGAGVDGIQWFGPHDSTMDDVQTFINGRYGLYVENTANYFGGGTMFSNFHSYGNANHGVLCNANIYCNGFESESNTGGDGIHIIDTDFGFFDARGVSVYNNSGNGFNITAGFATIAGIQAFNNTGNGVVVGAASTMSDVVAYSNGGMGVHVTADSWVFSAVRVFSNAGNGMQIDAPSTTNGVYTYMNGGDGLVINASDATADGINAQNNTGTGIKINGTFQSLVVSGKASGNATQLDLGTVAAPSIIDVVTFNTVTPAGQTSYTGTPGDVFLRIGTAGTGALSSLNQVQT